MDQVETTSISKIRHASRLKQVEAGDALFQQGERKNSMYVFLQGRAVVYQDKQALGLLQEGDYIGEYSLFLKKPYPATVIALEKLTVLQIEQDNMQMLFELEPALMTEIVMHVMQKLDSKIAVESLDKLMPMPVLDKPVTIDSTKIETTTASEEAVSLFPKEHAECTLNEEKMQEEYLYLKSYRCPICSHSFQQQTVRASRLVHEKTDDDMRMHYKGIEPL